MGISEFFRLSIGDIEKNYVNILGNLVFRKDRAVKKRGSKWSYRVGYNRVLRDPEEENGDHSWLWLFRSHISSVYSSFIIHFEEMKIPGGGYRMNIRSIQPGHWEPEVEIRDKSKTILDYLKWE